MGASYAKPRANDLRGSRFLALCAAEADATNTTTKVRVRLLLQGERRTLEVCSLAGISCTTIDQQGFDHDIGAVTNDGAMSSTFDWMLTRLKCFFRFRKRDGDTITIRLESTGTLHYSWVSEYELTHWEPDSKRNTCPLCGSLFSSFTRKHHCRCCGRLCCYKCSQHTAVLPIPAAPSACQFPLCLFCSTDTRADAPVRVCDTCYYYPRMVSDSPSMTSHSDSSNTEGECHYDKNGILHLDIPSNQTAILMHRYVSPSWKPTSSDQ